MSMIAKTLNIPAMLAITAAFRGYEHAPTPVREAQCLRAQFAAILDPLEPGDIFAGRISPAAVGFRHGSSVGEVGFYCEASLIQQGLALGELTADERSALEELLGFWQGRTTLSHVAARTQQPLSPEIARALVGDNISPDEPHIVSYASRLAGLSLDNRKLLRLGIPGLRAEVASHRQQAAAGQDDGSATAFFDGLLECLDLLGEVCLYYARQAREQAFAAPNEQRRQELGATGEALEQITIAPPATFREAIQLFWLYTLLAGVDNFGRMDTYLADFYVADVQAGRLIEEMALELLQGLWRLIDATIRPFCARVFLGGVGRPNPENADRFALLAIESTRRLRSLLPVLSLRVYQGMDPELWSSALDLLGEGMTYPILYNDDVFVRAAAIAFGAGQEEAEQYVTSDCGDHSLEHRSLGSPNGNINLAKALEVTLHNGVDPLSGERMGLALGELASFHTFDELWCAYTTQVEFFVRLVADCLVPLYSVMGEEAPFLFESLLIDDCLARGRGVFAGGARYRGVLIETYGNITTADSLAAIKHLVYDQRLMTSERMLQILTANFGGAERERLMMLNAPKYGNDDERADRVAGAVHDHMAQAIRAQAGRLGLDFCLADMINVDGHISAGRKVGATPDGRFAGAPLTNANSPSGGSDRRGPTALLSSLAKLSPEKMGGQVQYLKFSRDLFSTHRGRLEALLRQYFASGGNQAMVTVVGRGELESALREPQKYRHVIVRVGGFSARFVDLPPATQQDILARTLQEV